MSYAVQIITVPGENTNKIDLTMLKMPQSGEQCLLVIIFLNGASDTQAMWSRRHIPFPQLDQESKPVHPIAQLGYMYLITVLSLFSYQSQLFTRTI